MVQPNGIISRVVALGGGARLLWYLLLLLASSSCCSSQQCDHIQLSRIADSIEALTNSARAQERTSEKLASALTNIFTILTPEFIPCDEGWLKFGSSCYFFGKDKSTWHESRAKCITRNSDLVKITTDEEYNFLRNLVQGHDAWVGLNDLEVEDTYVWTDGTPYSMIRSWWDPPQPDYSHERCIHYWSKRSDRWNDAPCSWVLGYICEKTLSRIDV
ncbi:perlucin-like protein isoform X2 [Palaemon carinicauda]|uniref:perlucin-like protein isoform X2 n=1 Tax=Palaemon carinicauda TaxID=392227 RepID=UPI0035B67F44